MVFPSGEALGSGLTFGIEMRDPLFVRDVSSGLFEGYARVDHFRKLRAWLATESASEISVCHIRQCIDDEQRQPDDASDAGASSHSTPSDANTALQMFNHIVHAEIIPQLLAFLSALESASLAIVDPRASGFLLHCPELEALRDIAHDEDFNDFALAQEQLSQAAAAILKHKWHTPFTATPSTQGVNDIGRAYVDRLAELEKGKEDWARRVKVMAERQWKSRQKLLADDILNVYRRRRRTMNAGTGAMPPICSVTYTRAGTIIHTDRRGGALPRIPRRACRLPPFRSARWCAIPD